MQLHDILWAVHDGKTMVEATARKISRSSHYCMMLLTRRCDQRPFDKTVCDAIIANSGVKKLSKKVQNICDGGDIKHGSDCSYVCDAWHTVYPAELFAMRKNNRNGQPYQFVCDIRHTVRSDKLCAIRECKRSGQTDQGVCDI